MLRRHCRTKPRERENGGVVQHDRAQSSWSYQHKRTCMPSRRVKSYTMTAAAASASKPNAHTDMLNSPSKKKLSGLVKNAKTSAIARDGSTA